jgi:hypothetical protein
MRAELRAIVERLAAEGHVKRPRLRPKWVSEEDWTALVAVGRAAFQRGAEWAHIRIPSAHQAWVRNLELHLLPVLGSKTAMCVLGLGLLAEVTGVGREVSAEGFLSNRGGAVPAEWLAKWGPYAQCVDELKEVTWMLGGDFRGQGSARSASTLLVYKLREILKVLEACDATSTDRNLEVAVCQLTSVCEGLSET